MDFKDRVEAALIALGLPASWRPPAITLGDLVANGATLYSNTGAGYQMSFDAASDDEALVNIHLSNNGVAYDGSDVKIHLHSQLFATAPGGSDNVKIEIDYAFIKADGTQDAETLKDGTVVMDIDVSSRTEDLLYGDISGVLTGLAGASQLQLTIRRNSTGAGADSYSNAWDLYALEIEKV